MHLREKPLDRVADHRHAGQQFLDLGLQPGVEMGRAQPVERFGQSADPGANRHLVVVQDDDQILLQSAGVVHGLEDDAAGKGAVADHGHDASVFLRPQQIVAALHAQGGADAASGVAGHEQVVFAFGRVGIAHQPALGPHRVELLVAAGEHLVRVDLMAGVPDQAVAR